MLRHTETVFETAVGGEFYWNGKTFSGCFQAVRQAVVCCFNLSFPWHLNSGGSIDVSRPQVGILNDCWTSASEPLFVFTVVRCEVWIWNLTLMSACRKILCHATDFNLKSGRKHFLFSPALHLMMSQHGRRLGCHQGIWPRKKLEFPFITVLKRLSERWSESADKPQLALTVVCCDIWNILWLQKPNPLSHKLLRLLIFAFTRAYWAFFHYSCYNTTLWWSGPALA